MGLVDNFLGEWAGLGIVSIDADMGLLRWKSWKYSCLALHTGVLIGSGCYWTMMPSVLLLVILLVSDRQPIAYLVI